ncbi:MAG: ATP-binding protein [Chthoniobacter sp.]|uniref:sensor histidine kinase n=1 Tax=Chthoniobacter sp. TaxID=2510640 RepID=UPI0032A8A1DF
MPEQQGGELKLLEYALSHDVEGSVRGIKSVAAILLDKHAAALDGEAGELVQLLGAEAQRVSRLLDGLMGWLACAQQPLDFAWQDATKIAHEVFAKLSASGPERHIQFCVEPLPLLWSDSAALQAIFRELLANALKFTTGRSTPVVTVSAREAEGETVLAVQDNGVGFNALHGEQLFKLFRRMHRKTEFEGEGAGLAIVRQLMQRHGGRVWAEAQVNQGATLHLAFPKPISEEADTPAAVYS